jgi:twitching motility two-component system response regulator PilH
MISTEDITSQTRTVHSAKSSAVRGCVLIVEDTQALRRFLEICLERNGYTVVSAGDGQEAMNLLMTNSVDIVITDAIMPNLNGYELCRFIRNNPQLSHLPIVLLSALDPSPEEADQIDAFLIKPVSPEDLLDCVARLVKRAVM